MYDSVGKDVAELHSVIGQDLADEQPAMALTRLALAAQQRDPVLATADQQAPHGRLESGLLCHAVIASTAMLVVMLLP
jgi:hypothetical protein